MKSLEQCKLGVSWLRDASGRSEEQGPKDTRYRAACAVHHRRSEYIVYKNKTKAVRRLRGDVGDSVVAVQGGPLSALLRSTKLMRFRSRNVQTYI